MQTDQSGKPGIIRTPLYLESLASEARSAEGGEAYAELSRSPGYRLGVVASTFPSGCVYYTVECTFRLFSPDASIEPTMLERAAEITRRLERSGYDLTHLDDGWISCEKIMPREEVDAEVNGLLHSLVLWACQKPGGSRDCGRPTP